MSGATQVQRSPGVWLRALSLAGVLGLLFWLLSHYRVLDYCAPDRIESTVAAIRGWVDGFGVLGPAVFLTASSAAIAANIPAGLITCLAVMLFGPIFGCLLGFLIAAAGISLVHLIAQKLGRPLIRRLTGNRMASAETQLAQRGLRTVILLRLVFFMTPALNWTLGLSPLPYRTLVLGTIIGAAPGIITISWLSHAFIEAISSGQSINPLRFPQLWIPLGSALLLLGVPPLVDRVRRRRASLANRQERQP